ncbi:histidine phosphatase family protein [Desulfovibrio sp. ZJ369]|uniref:histidine phosphatase family protein n=1 Tax=Desulfovibrio sp. ZJ369 TaxID=2709793 RepID=UPI0013EA0680|nr:histidine phosphatase family protein [Desulfovibrio sp. ZJ369]
MSGLWLVRHGALPPNPERRFVGARDLPLSEAGRAQIRGLARDFAPVLKSGALAAVLSSDLERCRETAAIIATAAAWAAGAEGKGTTAATSVPLHADADLREINLGSWQGLTPQEVRQAFPGQYERRGKDPARFRPPGGESFADVQRRALAALARWRARYPEGQLLLAGHAGLNRTLLARYLALPLSEALRIPQPYACRAFLPGW